MKFLFLVGMAVAIKSYATPPGDLAAHALKEGSVAMAARDLAVGQGPTDVELVIRGTSRVTDGTLKSLHTQNRLLKCVLDTSGRATIPKGSRAILSINGSSLREILLGMEFRSLGLALEIRCTVREVKQVRHWLPNYDRARTHEWKLWENEEVAQLPLASDLVPLLAILDK